MTLFRKNRVLYHRGRSSVAVVALASILGCSAENKDTTETQNLVKPQTAKPEVKATQLGADEERCNEADKGRVCVTNVETTGGDAEGDALRQSDAGARDGQSAASLEDGGQRADEVFTSEDLTTNDQGDTNNALADAGIEPNDDARGVDAAAGVDEPSRDEGSPAAPWTKECAAISGTVRDFRRGDREGGHPDFETRPGADEKGLVKRRLSPAGRPQLALSRPVSIESADSFKQWYEDVPGVNASFNIALQLERDGEYQEFGTTSFFPLEDLGFGPEDLGHNFGFTTELHAKFLFEGWGTFQLAGDDDLWLFVNGHLVIDLGGVHAWQTDTVDVGERAKELGLEPGNVYSLDVFHAERHSDESKLVARTNLFLVDCD